jgi:hypothetical protein
LVRAGAVDDTKAIVEHRVMEGFVVRRECVRAFLRLMMRKNSILTGTIRNFVRGGAVEPIRPWLR